MIICGTGHRPKDLPCQYNEQHPFKLAVESALNSWISLNRPDLICSGMALGYDTWLAEAALAHKILFIAFVPMPGQEKMWPTNAQKRYKKILDRADQVVYNSKEEKYHPDLMLARNINMVNFSDKVLALWNGKMSGGTYHCINYAKSQKKEIVNLWSAAASVKSVKN